MPLMPKRILTVAACLLLAGAAWAVDVIVDTRADLGVMYMLPIAAAGWLLGLRWGVGLGLLCLTVVTGHAMMAYGLDFPEPNWFYWNTAERVVLFMLVAVAADRLRSKRANLERIVRERTAQLQQELAVQRRLEAQLLQTEDAELSRLGRELHDSLGQDLTGISFLAKELGDSLAGRGLAESQDAAKLATYATAAVRKAGLMAHGLCPTGLNGQGLPRALNELAEQVREVFGLECVVENAEALGAVRDENVAAQLYRIAQEAVRNAVRHGRPRRISIQAALTDGHGLLEIADDGVGFVAPPAGGGGIGLSVMQYRANSIGGQLAVGPMRPKGTSVRCEWPTTAGAAPASQDES